MPIDRDQIKHVAELASLSLTEEEIGEMATDLDAIVRYVEELNQLDTTGVMPTSHVVAEAAPWRADEVKPGVSHEDALSQAPRTAQDGFAVPAFVES